MSAAPVPEAMIAAEEARQARRPIVHPLTGEVLPDDLATLRDLEEQVDRFLRRLGPHYGFRGDLRERIAELQGPALLPERRNRTDKQHAVSACPRCGAKTV